MKKILSLTLLHLFCFVLTAQNNYNLDESVFASSNIEHPEKIIDSIKIIPENPTRINPIRFATFSPPFGGDCTYQLNVDSVIDAKIYISGKFNNQAKCKEKGACDTVEIGLLSPGAYELIYKFIDIYDETEGFIIPTEEYTLPFVVDNVVGLQSIEKQQLEIFPNPCNTYINVSFPAMNNEYKYIRLFDSSGKIVYETQTDQEQLQIDMSKYMQGVYSVWLLNNGVSGYKIIKE